MVTLNRKIIDFIDNKIFKNGNLLIYFFILACFLSRINSDYFFIDILSNLSFQILLGGFFLIGILIILKRYLAIIICLVICSIYGVLISYECNNCNTITKKNNDNSQNLKIMLYNIGYNNSVKNFTNLKNLIVSEKIELILLQEISPSTIDKVKLLKQIFPYGSSLDDHIDLFDTIILSKYPLKQLENKDYHISKANLVINNDVISILGVHLRPGGRQQDYEFALNQLSYLKKIISNRSSKLILLGDLNMTAYSKRFSNFINDTNLNTYISYKNKTSTWPSFLPNFFGIQIDHLLFSDEINLISKKIGESFGSDHRPLITEISF